MKFLKQILCVALLSLVAVSGEVSAQTYDFSAVDKLLQDSLAVLAGQGLQSGGGCALILTQNGKTIYNKSFVLPNRMYSADRIVPIASATKWYSAAVIMSLADEGKLSLDDTTGRFLPSYATRTDGKSRMSIRQLFSHTSGLPGRTDAPCLDDNTFTLATCVEQIATLTLAAAPGVQFAYGGNSMHVAGRIAEIASGLGLPSGLPSGKAWDTLFAQRIARLLGMNATKYDGSFMGDTDNPMIAGSARSSAEDYAKFLAMLINKGLAPDGRRVLSEQAIATMLADQTRGARIAFSPYQQYASIDSALLQTRYGIGNWCEVVDAATGRTIESNSLGAFGFAPWIDRSRNLAGVLSIFSDNAKTFPTYYKLKQLIRQIVPVVTTGVRSSLSRNQVFYVSPNPASGSIGINGADDSGITAEVVIMNVLGQVVLSQKGITMPATLDVSSLVEGMYVCAISTANQRCIHPIQILR
jgi:CubicO group peptidase (beta-lactamase class C family)